MDEAATLDLLTKVHSLFETTGKLHDNLAAIVKLHITRLDTELADIRDGMVQLDERIRAIGIRQSVLSGVPIKEDDAA